MGFGLSPGASKQGNWGPVTSTLDWCEENYLITPHIAEFWNATSNVFFLAAALVGLWSANRCGISEQRTYWSLFSIAAVGFGSFLFHGSLLFHTQMMDELPMIYGSSVFVFAALRVFPETNKNNSLLAGGLVVYAAAVTGMYLYLQNPVFHEVCYGILAAILFLTPPQQFYYIKKKYPQYKARVPQLWSLYWYGAISYLLGFLLWNIENQLCYEIRALKDSLGFPLRLFLELHAFGWHLGTALGTYASILEITYVRQLALGREDVVVIWVCGGLVPLLTSVLSREEVRKRVAKQKKM